MALKPGQNIGLKPRKLRQTLGNQGGQEITAYVPDPTQFTGVQGTEYGQGQAPNLQYVPDTIYKQYKDAQGNLFELVPSQNPAGLSDPQTYLRQLSGTPQGYSQTPQDILRTSRNLPQGWEQDIYGAAQKSAALDILPGESAEAYYKRTGVGYSPAFGGQMPAPKQLSNVQAPNLTTAGSNVGNASIPTAASIQQNLQDFLARIQKEGITGAKGEVLLAPGSLKTQGGQISPEITAEGLGQAQKQITLPTTTQQGTTTANDTAAAAVAGVTGGSKTFADFYKDFTPPETETDKLYKDLVAKYGEEIEGLKGRGEYQLAQEKAQEIQAKKEAMRINQGKIDALNAEFEKYSLDEQGKPITLASITGAIQAKRNAIAGQMLMLQASQSLLVGQYNDAVEAVNRAVDFKYQDAKDAVEIRLKQIELVKDQLTTQQKRYSDAMTAYLNQQKDLINQQQAYDLALYKEKLDIISKYNVGELTDSLETLTQKKLGSAVYKKEIAGGGGDDNSAAVSYYADQVSSGIIDISNVPANVRNDVAAKLNEPVKGTEIDRNTIEGIKSRIKTAKDGGFTDEEIKETIKETYTTDELFALAKSAGYAKWYTGKSSDIDRMLNAILTE